MLKTQIVLCMFSFMFLCNSQNYPIASFQDCQTDSACASCVNDTCTMCLMGYSLHSSGVCMKCPLYCIQCISNGRCLICAFNYVLEDGICSLSWNTGCLLSYNTWTCVLCVQGRYFADTTVNCDLCMPHCLSCTNFSSCHLCRNGYFLSVSTSGKMECSACNAQCANCSSTSTNCTVCNIDSYLINNHCISCYLTLPFCITCNLPTNSSDPICSLCQTGMVISSNGSCLRCPEGCSFCLNTTTCSICKIMFFLNKQNLCQPCGMQGCWKCNNNKTCTQCQRGFVLATKQHQTLCIACVPNCQICQSINQCGTCLINAYINSSTYLCSPCMENCQICGSQSSCTKCFDGFYKIELHKQFKCMACPVYCPLCYLFNNQISCDYYCSPGDYYISSEDACIPCPVDNCFNCNTTYATNSCFFCNSGFYLTDQGQCNPCSQGCGICQNTFSCQDCVDGYFYQDGKCIACYSGCSSCNSTMCFSCAQGFFLSSPQAQSQSQSQCQSCPTGCLNCVAENICTFCLPGYFLLSPPSSSSQSSQPSFQICSPCTQPCSICSSNSTCLICQRGFILNSVGKCTPCPNNFAICEKGYKLQCLDRFTLVVNVSNSISDSSEECLPCANGCEKCKYQYNNKSLICLSCSLGYSQTITGQCFQCGTTNSTTGCLSCSPSGSCESCLSGFTLNNGACTNSNFGTDSQWLLIGADIALGCLSMILISTSYFIQLSFLSNAVKAQPKLQVLVWNSQMENDVIIFQLSKIITNQIASI